MTLFFCNYSVKMKIFLFALLAVVCGLAASEVYYEENFVDGEFLEIIALFSHATSCVIFSLSAIGKFGENSQSALDTP